MHVFHCLVTLVYLFIIYLLFIYYVFHCLVTIVTVWAKFANTVNKISLGRWWLIRYISWLANTMCVYGVCYINHARASIDFKNLLNSHLLNSKLKLIALDQICKKKVKIKYNTFSQKFTWPKTCQNLDKLSEMP